MEVGSGIKSLYIFIYIEEELKSPRTGLVRESKRGHTRGERYSSQAPGGGSQFAGPIPTILSRLL